MVRSAAAALVALVAAAVVAPPAAAHTSLVGSNPEDGATVETLDEVSLSFTEQLLEIGNELVLEAPDGTRTVLEVSDPITETITAEVPAGVLQPGENTLVWRVVAGDGHPIEGTVTFTYAPASSATPTPTPTASPTASASPPATVAPLTTPTPSPSPSSSPTADAGGAGIPWWWVRVAAGMLAAVGVPAVIAARRRPGD